MLTEILLGIGLILLVVNSVLILSKKPLSDMGDLKTELSKLSHEVARLDALVRTEFSTNRTETEHHAQHTRQELSRSFHSFSEQQTSKTDTLTQNFTQNAKEHRTELTQSLQSFEEKFSKSVTQMHDLQHQKFNEIQHKQDQMRSDTALSLEKIRETVEAKITSLQDNNAKKLEEMRAMVDEKLQATLEKRFNDSFTMISERLELVHKGLGEMQVLATSVGDLKKVMSNVKSRGILGEYQLENILEDLLTNEQYEKNVKTKAGSGAIVEFAIKLPNNNSLEKTLWLPIDSKFPKEDYEALVEAYETGEADQLDILRKNFKQAIIKNAKDIKDKYIDPPNTTEYGIMFLPFESLYAEVLRTPGLFEHLQKDYKITITGPTTLSALLNSLQMGFRTLAIEKRSSEVWDLLSVVKTEFGQFGTVLAKTKKKLQEAANTIDNASVRSRAIEKQLRKVQELPSNANQQLIQAELNSGQKDLENEWMLLDD